MNAGRRPLLLALLLAACNRYPESYPPPEQRQPPTAEEAGEAMEFVAMNDPDAESYFVRDIRGLEAGSWRWTGQQPTLRFALDHTNNRQFVMDFAVADAALRETGPITITVFVNERLLDRMRYQTHGEKHFEKAVDPSWLEAGEKTTVEIALDKVWVSPTDGTRLGVILLRAGFVDR